MAQSLNRRQTSSSSRTFFGMAAAILLVLACSLSSVVYAENFRDPTRPPTSFDGGYQSGADSSSGPQLQSILVSPDRRVATISGRTLRVGDKVGDARVEKILETEVVLRSGSSVQTLKLFPEVEKHHNSMRSTKSIVNSHVVKVKDR